MPKRALAAVAGLLLPIVVNVAPAQADPLPAFCAPDRVVDNVCSVRLKSVTADVIDGTITGTPIDGGTAVTLAGQVDAYLPSAGFGVKPDSVQRWDDTLDRVNSLSVDPSDPNWYGNAKSRAFLPRTLNDLASLFPTGVLTVRFTPDDATPGVFQLVSIQPTAR